MRILLRFAPPDDSGEVKTEVGSLHLFSHVAVIEISTFDETTMTGDAIRSSTAQAKAVQRARKRIALQSRPDLSNEARLHVNHGKE